MGSWALAVAAMAAVTAMASGAARVCEDELAGRWACSTAGLGCCAVGRASGGSVAGFCVPCPTKGPMARTCHSRRDWDALLREPSMGAFLPTPLKEAAFRGPHATFQVQPAAKSTLDSTFNNTHESMLNSTLDLKSALSSSTCSVGGVVHTCGGSRGCCASWRASPAGDWAGLGCESCGVGEGEMDFVRYRGGGGAQLFHSPWDDETELCVWARPRCYRQQKDSRTMRVQTCSDGQDCCFTKADGLKGCASCQRSQATLLRCAESGECRCRGDLCNSRHPAEPSPQTTPTEPPQDSLLPSETLRIVVDGGLLDPGLAAQLNALGRSDGAHGQLAAQDDAPTPAAAFPAIASPLVLLVATSLHV